METLKTLLIIAFFITAVLLVIAVLLQSNKGGGLQGMLGGAAQSNPFGTSATDVMANVTKILGLVFMSICFGFAFFFAKKPASVEDAKSAFTLPVDQKDAKAGKDKDSMAADKKDASKNEENDEEKNAEKDAE